MMKRKQQSNPALDRAAEAVGRGLGGVIGTIDSLQAQHPHPVDEAREALAAGEKTLAAAASKAGARATAMVKTAKAAVRRTKKTATEARRKSAPTVARATRTARDVVKRAKKAVARGRKTVRSVAKRLKR